MDEEGVEGKQEAKESVRLGRSRGQRGLFLLPVFLLFPSLTLGAPPLHVFAHAEAVMQDLALFSGFRNSGGKCHASYCSPTLWNWLLHLRTPSSAASIW